jgi:predicted PurR-regulated permease PerM
VVAVVGGLVYLLRYILLIFALGAALTLVLQPPLRWMMLRGHVPRWLAGVILFVALLAFIGGGGNWLVQVMWSDVGRLLRNLPEVLRTMLETILGPGNRQIFGQNINAAALSQKATAALGRQVQSPQDLLKLVVGGFSGAMGLFLTLLITLYGLLTGPRMGRGLLWLVPPDWRPAVRRFAAELAPVLRSYVIGVITIIFVTAVLAWIALDWGLGLPHAVLLALLVGVLEFIPVAGPALSIAVVSVVAVSEGSAWTIFGVAIFFVGLRLLIDQVMGPLVLGRAVTLHPVTVLFALLTGMVLFGALGVLLAVPCAAAIKLGLRHYYENSDPQKKPVPGQGTEKTERRPS